MGDIEKDIETALQGSRRASKFSALVFAAVLIISVLLGWVAFNNTVALANMQKMMKQQQKTINNLSSELARLKAER